MAVSQNDRSSTDPVRSGELDNERRLFRIMVWGYLTCVPGMALFIGTAILSGSASLGVYAVQYPISLAVQTFSLYAVRQGMKRNTWRFPYGTGKLESFSAFLFGALSIPSGLYLAFHAVVRLGEPGPVGYTLGMAPLILSVSREAILYLACVRLARATRVHSPVLQSYAIGYQVGLFSDAGLMISFAIGWSLVRLGVPEIGERVDPAIALGLALYMTGTGVWLVWGNFRDLMDLPLPEAEHLRILKALAARFDDFENIGAIYTRASGSVRFVELELTFHPSRTIGEIDALRRAMERALAEDIPGLNFKIVPGTPDPAPGHSPNPVPPISSHVTEHAGNA